MVRGINSTETYYFLLFYAVGLVLVLTVRGVTKGSELKVNEDERMVLICIPTSGKYVQLQM